MISAAVPVIKQPLKFEISFGDIFLYLSVGKYEEFSLQKSVSACVIAKSKIKKDMSPQEARKICEVEIKQNK